MWRQIETKCPINTAWKSYQRLAMCGVDHHKIEGSNPCYSNHLAWPRGGTGRRSGFKIHRAKAHVSSSLTEATITTKTECLMSEIEKEKKWLLGEVPEISWEHQTVRIEQIYNPYNVDQSERVRKTTKEDGTSSFYHCVKTPQEPGVNIEDEVEITEDEYLGKFDQYHRAGAHKIVKDRIIFEWGNHVFDWVLELDIFKRPKCIKGLTVLEVELMFMEEVPAIPNNFVILEEITGEARFSNKQISLKPEKTLREAFKVSSRVATELSKEKE